MQASDIATIVRGPAIARLRGKTVHGRPLMLGLLAWVPLAAVRFSQGPLQPELAAMGLLVPLAFLPLCIKTSSMRQEPAPRLILALTKMAFLLFATLSLHGIWHWLVHHHE